MGARAAEAAAAVPLREEDPRRPSRDGLYFMVRDGLISRLSIASVGTDLWRRSVASETKAHYVLIQFMRHATFEAHCLPHLKAALVRRRGRHTGRMLARPADALLKELQHPVSAACLAVALGA